MRIPKTHLLIIGALLTGAIVLSSSLAQDRTLATGGTRTAVCDIVKIFDNYTRGKQLSKDFTERARKLQAEDQQRVKVIEELNRELEGLMPESKEYERRLSRAEKLTIDRKNWMQYQSRLAERDRLRLTKQMYDEIITMIGKIARQRGIQLVLYRRSQDQKAENMAQMLQQVELRKVVYASESVDLTDTVLLALNEAHRNRKK
jgi:Skp family chaperone for outer membrane proteins